MKQLETGIIFVFINVKRFKRSFFEAYTIIYAIKPLGSVNLNILFRVRRVNGNRGTFVRPNQARIFLFTNKIIAG